MKVLKAFAMLALLLVSTSTLPVKTLYAATYTVTQSTDDGSGSASGALSWAINLSNNGGDDTINFSGVATISITGARPAIADDGTTIDGGVGVTLDWNGSGSGVDGLEIKGGYSNTRIDNITIKHLNIKDFPGAGIYAHPSQSGTGYTIEYCSIYSNDEHGIYLDGISSSTISNNRIGVDENGNEAGNGYTGLVLGLTEE